MQWIQQVKSPTESALEVTEWNYESMLLQFPICIQFILAEIVEIKTKYHKVIRIFLLLESLLFFSSLTIEKCRYGLWKINMDHMLDYGESFQRSS